MNLLDVKVPVNKAGLDKLYDKGLDWVIVVGPKLLVAIIVFIIGQLIINLARRKAKQRMQRGNFNASLRPFVSSVIFTVLEVLLVLLIMQIVGIQLTLFAALIAAMGAAAGLALSGTLQNFASGVLILLLKPFRVGDNIIAQGQEGTVEAIRLFYSVVTTYDNKTVIFPNSKLSNEVIVNVTCEGKRRMDIELTFKYNTDIAAVKQAILDIIDKDKDVLKDPAVRIGVTKLQTDSYNLLLNVWINAHGFEDTRLQFQEHLIEGLKASGIKLPGME